MDGAMENLYRKIAAIGRRFRAERVVLFGSRARGDNRSRSDIDIAVFGVSPDDLPAFREQLDELPTLLEFDLVFVTEDHSLICPDHVIPGLCPQKSKGKISLNFAPAYDHCSLHL